MSHFLEKIRHLMPGHAGKDGLNNFKKHQALQESHSPNFNKSIHSLLPIREEAESVLVFTNITAEERRQYAAVVEKCEEFFQVYARTSFLKKLGSTGTNKQERQRSSTIWHSTPLAESCEYGETKDEMIRNRL